MFFDKKHSLPKVLKCSSCGFTSKESNDFCIEVPCEHACRHFFCKRVACKAAAIKSKPLDYIDFHSRSLPCKCVCGYEPDSESDNSPPCTSTEVLRNHMTFPSLKMMPQPLINSPIYYKRVRNRPVPRLHWALLVELTEKVSVEQNVDIWTTINAYEEESVCIVSKNCGSSPKTYSMGDLQTGRTLCILYAKKLIGKYQLCLFDDTFDMTIVFKAPLKFVYAEAAKLVRDADAKANSEHSACFECGVSGDSLKSCGKCKLAKYCSVVGHAFLFRVYLYTGIPHF